MVFRIIHSLSKRKDKALSDLLPGLSVGHCIMLSLLYSWLACKLKLDNVLNRDREGKEEFVWPVNLTGENRRSSVYD